MKGLVRGIRMRKVGRAVGSLSAPSALFISIDAAMATTHRKLAQPGSNRFRDLADTSPAAVWFS